MNEYGFFNDPAVVLAHRGDSVRFPENTMPAFKSAAEMGVDVIETDVQITKDGKVIIWHDDDISRITGTSGAVTDCTYDQLKTFDAGYTFTVDGGQSFPFRNCGVSVVLLEDLLSELPDCRFNIDLKTPEPELVRTFVRIVKKAGAADRILGASFHHRNLILLRKLLPAMATSFSMQEVKIMLIQQKLGLLRLRRKFPGQVLQIPERSGSLKVLTSRFLKTVHQKGLYVQIWTVNDTEDMKRLLKMGVDGLFTDNPAELLALVQHF